MSEEVKKDTSTLLRTTSYGGLTASETSFDIIDKTAKKISSKVEESISNVSYDNTESMIYTNEYQEKKSNFSSDNLVVNHATRYQNKDMDDVERFKISEHEDISYLYDNDFENSDDYGHPSESDYHLELNEEYHYEQKDKSVYQLDYNSYDDYDVSSLDANHALYPDLRASGIKTSSKSDNDNFLNYETNSYTYDNSYMGNYAGKLDDLAYSDDEPPLEGDHEFKDIKDDLFDKLNKATFDFNENQGMISKSFTVVGKSGKALSKGGKTLIRTSRSINKAIDEKDSGIEYLQDEAYRKTSKKLVKKSKKPAKNLVKRSFKAIFRKIRNVLKKKIVKILVCASVGIEVLPILGAVVAGVVTVTSIFGGGASTKVLTKYENYMQSVQESYDRKVDDFMKKYPDGIVVGVNGGYGKIDWKVPLSIIQGCDGDISYSAGEKDILKKFKAANLYEKHTISEQKVYYEDKGKDKVKTIKVLTITNPGYEDYMRWSKKNFDQYKTFLKSKGVYKSGQKNFNKNQLEVINKLYNSELFFDAFGDDFKEHDTVTGSNKTEKNFNSPEYNSQNIFTNAGFKGQCTWYAYGRALKVTKKKMPSGNAQTWLSSAVAMGMPTGSKPSVNAVIVLSGGGFGHVAFVEAWDGKKITVSEGNYRNPYYNNPDMMVSYAREHAVELVHEETYKSFEEYKRRQTAVGLTVVGFIYEK